MPDKENFNGVVSYGLDRASYNQGKNAKFGISIEEEEAALVSKGPNAACKCDAADESDEPTVRRLTPTETDRLQCYPDGWTDLGEWEDERGKKHKPADTPRYKADGNSVCTPFWAWLDKRISAYYDHAPTLGSLFDGISGFPLVHALVNGEETVRWGSEIEQFPIAVAKRHFGDEDAGIEGDFEEAIAKFHPVCALALHEALKGE